MAVVQIDEENCFGRREWMICEDYPGMGPWTCWKHAQYSYVNQTHDIETLKNRGGEQGDTQG
eukprot:8133600-Lingulodinium_polyedra.AAC.1